eukprot:Skav236765  [mRNA]  locus=scaffold2707:49048:51246:- [translate_table: standard]
MRLALAMQVSQVAPASLQDMLVRERDVFDQSWLHAVAHAQEWLLGMLPPDHPVHSLPLKEHVFLALSQLAIEHRGHSLLRRTYHKYLLQEKIAQDVLDAGDTYKHLIAEAGIETAPGDPHAPVANADYPCPQCGMTFSTPQGRQAHCWKQHGALSLERRLSFGVTCRACHKCLWTSARIQQHLRNSRLRGSGCYYILAERFLPDEQPEHVSLPPGLTHLERIPAQLAEGPLAPLPPRAFFPPAYHVPEWKHRWCQANLSWRLLKDDYQRIADALDKLVANAALTVDSDLLDDAIGFMETVATEGTLSAPDVAWAYAIWYRRQLHGGWPRDWDDVWHRRMMEVLHPLCSDIHPYQLLEEAQKIPGCLRDLPDGWVDEASHDGRLQLPKEPFALRYPQLGNVFEDWRDRQRLHDLPALPVPLLQDDNGQLCLVVLHLFSGRRRWCDFHHWVKYYLGAVLPQYSAMVLSVDTAVDYVDGNLASGPAISALQELTTAPAVAGAAAGPPCETWTAARRQAVELPNHRRAPRPLRDAQAPWGLQHLSYRELLQLQVANHLMLGNLRWELQTALHGGGSMMEHPDEAPDQEASSIWRTGLHHYFLEDVMAAQRVPIQQWQYGSAATKPTMLRALNLEGIADGMAAARDVHAAPPSKVLVGFDSSSNRFHTSAAKEYPPKMAQAMAYSLVEATERKLAIFGTAIFKFSDLTGPTQGWVRRMLTAAELPGTDTYLPDYQRS